MARQFQVKTHRHCARFTIPKDVREDLGLRSTGGDSVQLKIDGLTGHYEGIKILRSGSEIYGKDLTEAGIKRAQLITVEASRPRWNKD